MFLRILILILFSIYGLPEGIGQTCNNWLRTNNAFESVTIGDLDVSGKKITVEALINRTAPWTGGYNYAGDIVSKHDLPNNVNYLLRPNNAEITTSNGYFSTPPVCPIELNKTYHVAMVYDGAALKFYRNGFLMSQVAVQGNMVNNNFLTTIGDYAYPNPVGTNFVGYINEVRIWNIARTQDEIRNSMTGPLPNPALQTGLQAYYTFDNLLNKQGNVAWNGLLNGAASIQSSNPTCSLIADTCYARNNVGNIINHYTPVIAFNPCNNELVVEDGSSFKIGDTVLMIQMKGANVDSSNTSLFGNIANYRSAGNYEFNYISQKSGNTLTLKNFLTRTYNIPDGKVQLVRVPYYTRANVTATLTCLPWDGRKGGVLVLNVRDTITLEADIDVSSKGFPGATGVNTNQAGFNCFENNYFYPQTAGDLAAKKGEGLSDISSQRIFGKGKLANAGGGGNSHNSGGGGGGNGGTGGFGGYQLLSCNNAAFDNRGIGGSALIYNNTNNKIFMGGGGGAGHANNPQGFTGNGGNGGGIAIIRARYLANNGNTIKSNGQDAAACTLFGTGCHEGMGGGGAGGTIIMDVSNILNSIQVIASGGKGGNMVDATANLLGPGGGGGGGITWFKTATQPVLVNTVLSGGASGTCINNSNDPWGATPGQTGSNLFTVNVPVDSVLFARNIDTVFTTFNIQTCLNYDLSGVASILNAPIAQWQWYFEDGSVRSGQNLNHTFSGSGTQTIRLTVTDTNGCKDSSLLSINVTQAQVNAGPDQQFCAAASITAQLNASGNGSINWLPSTALSNTTIPNPSANISSTTTFYAQSTISPFCTAIDSVRIIVLPAYTTSETRSTCAGQLPFIWNGITVNTGGAYVANLVTATGCDSIVTLQLNITDTIRSVASHRICDNQGPYSWNGLQLTASGTYSVPLTAISGCDSLATLNFTVNNATFSTTASSVCQGDLPFLWNGRTFNAAGSYQAVLTNLAGCDSTANLNLVILPSANSVLNRHICESDAPFLWNGQTLTGSGQFNTTLTAANGCDSVATLNLTVNPTLRSETRVDICRNAAPYLWNGQSYSTPGSHFVNLLSSTGCDSIATLVLSINDNAATNIRRQICTAQLPYSWNGITINGTGTFTANLNTIAGCDSVVTLDLEVAPNLTSNIASAVCNSAFPYVWNGLTIGAPGNYTATLRASSGCDSLVTVTVSTLAVQPVQTTPTVTRCEGTNLVLNATPGYAAYHWSPGNLVTDSTIMNPGYTGTGALQQLIVRAVDNNGCTTSDTTVITSRPNPVVRTIADSSLCRAQQITLLATGAAAYNWSPFTQLNNSTSAAPLLTANISQTIYVTGTDNFGCMGRDTVNITVRSADDLVAPTGGAVCSRSNITLHGANGSAYNYSWSPSSTLNNANVENPLATPVASTIYSVRITDTLCNYYKNFQVPVTVRQLPDVVAQKSNDISCAQRSAQLTASGANVFQWQSHPTLSNLSGATATARPTVSTIYTVTGTDANGCKNSDTVKINVLPGKEIYNIPNAFTPNGDGLNDCFGIKHWGDATDVTFRIYNRYGQLVFETSDVNECWNGKFKGKAADAGNYVFIAMANSACGKMEKKGNVLLIR